MVSADGEVDARADGVHDEGGDTGAAGEFGGQGGGAVPHVASCGPHGPRRSTPGGAAAPPWLGLSSRAGRGGN